MDREKLLKGLGNGFSESALVMLLEDLAPTFSLVDQDLNRLVTPDLGVGQLKLLGRLDFGNDSMVVVTGKLANPLTRHSGRRGQWKTAVSVLKDLREDPFGGLFVFYDENGAFRFSLVQARFMGKRRKWSNYRRSSFQVEPGQPNKTFVSQLKDADFSNPDGVSAAFSVEAVTDSFYREFSRYFEKLALAVRSGTNTEVPADKARDIALLFSIRTIFLGFVQKNGWLAGKKNFLQWMLGEYKRTGQDNRFYTDYLEPLYFEALKHPWGSRRRVENSSSAWCW